jgi:hypothetical protein
MMEENSTTALADDQSTQTEPNEATEQQTATATADNSDNLDASQETDTKDDNSSGEGETPPPKFDDDLDDWAAKTGRKAPESDDERELLQEIRNGQRDYSRKQQAAKEFDKTLKDNKPTTNSQEDDDEDPLEKKYRDLSERLSNSENTRIRSEYFATNDVTEDESKIMGDILKEKVDKGGQKAFDYWTDPDNLQDWHDLAKARLAKSTDTSQIEAEAARRERVRIAKESQANGPARNATTTTSSKKTLDQERLERFSNWE